MACRPSSCLHAPCCQTSLGLLMLITLTITSSGRSFRVHIPCLQRMEVDCSACMIAEMPIASDFSCVSNTLHARDNLAHTDLRDLGGPFSGTYPSEGSLSCLPAT